MGIVEPIRCTDASAGGRQRLLHGQSCGSQTHSAYGLAISIKLEEATSVAVCPLAWIGCGLPRPPTPCLFHFDPFPSPAHVASDAAYRIVCIFNDDKPSPPGPSPPDSMG